MTTHRSARNRHLATILIATASLVSGLGLLAGPAGARGHSARAAAATAPALAWPADSHHGPRFFLASPPPGISRLFAVSCSSPQWCAFALGVQNKHNQVLPALAVTIDGGQSWYENPIAPPGAQFATMRITGLACATVENCIVVGYSLQQHPVVYVTASAGLTWRDALVPAGAPAGSLLTAAACPSEARCIAVGSLPEPLLSDDGGLRWSLGKPYPGGLGQLWGISCPQPSKCVGLAGAGNPNPMLVSGDEGTTWKRSGSLPSASPFTLSCVNALTCVAMGTSSAYLTGNGGASWRAGVLDKKESNGFQSVACASSLLCVAVGVSDAQGYPQPVLSFTLDGGRTWH